jgi:hypothetical protein
MKKKVLKKLYKHHKRLSEVLKEQRDRWEKEAMFKSDENGKLKNNEFHRKAEIEKILGERMEVVLEEKEALKFENDEVLEKVELLAALADLQTRIIHSSNFEEMTKDESLNFSNLFYFVKRSILNFEY